MEIRYYINGEERVLIAEPRIRTAELRAKINKLEIDNQKKYKKEMMPVMESKAAQLELTRNLALQECKNNGGNIDDSQVKEMLGAAFISMLGDEEIQERGEMIAKSRDWFETSRVELFKLIVRRDKLSEEEVKLVESPSDSEFWRNIDEEAVQEFCDTFRARHKV